MEIDHVLKSQVTKVVHVYRVGKIGYVADLYEFQNDILVLLASTSSIERPIYLMELAQRAGWHVDEW